MVFSQTVNSGHHGKHQDKGDEELNTKHLPHADPRPGSRGAQIIRLPDVKARRGEEHQNSGPDNSTSHLDHDIEGRSEEADLSGDKETHGDGRVDVTPGDMSNTPDHCTHSQTEA